MAALSNVGSAQSAVLAKAAYQAKTAGPATLGISSLQTPAYSVELSGKNEKSSAEIQRLKRTGQIECQTCKERMYQDGSNDPGVSFKAPGHISPESSGAVVMAHEQEHVTNEQANARAEGGKVVAQSVRIFTSVCPECGRTYVSGGQTNTTTSTPTRSDQAETALGKNLDLSA